jgi:hypothetical protein
MIAIVNIDLSNMPNKEKFSNDKKSIKIRKYEHNDAYRLETRFSMKTIAQYKVVDQIFHDFEFASDNYDDFLDISVSFQK